MTRTAQGDESYGLSLARAFAGAVIFAFPLLMTMEMWELGFHLDRLKLALLVMATVAVVYGLSVYAGFRETANWADDLLDTFAAMLVGFVAAGLLLALFGQLDAQTPLREAVGKVAIEGSPAAMGAMLANKQLGQRGGPDADGGHEDQAGYGGQLFLMLAGGLFLAFNVAPTEEVRVINYAISPWQAMALMGASLALLHALVFTVGFAGQVAHDSPAKAFLHFTLPGYGIALTASLYILWTFGHTDGAALGEVAGSMVVLGFPAALGGAVARLLV